jgi:Mrp family chromosome partitioning ATPase
VITHVSSGAAHELAPLWRSNRRVRTVCEGILHRLGWPGPDGEAAVRTLGLSSCRPGEGVTTLATHLAVAAAAHDRGPVLLVDCNWADPAAAGLLGVEAAPGLAECLRAEEDWSAAIRPAAANNLWVLPGGQAHGSLAAVYQSAALAPLVKELAAGFPLVVFDMPAATQASCIAHLAGLLDGVLLVVAAGRVRPEAAQRVKELFLGANARLLGAVLNRQHDGAPDWV